MIQLIKMDDALAEIFSVLHSTCHGMTGYSGIEVFVDGQTTEITLKPVISTGHKEAVVQEPEKPAEKAMSAEPIKEVKVKTGRPKKIPIPETTEEIKAEAEQKKVSKKWIKVAKLIKEGADPSNAFRSVNGYSWAKDHILAYLEEKGLVSTPAEKIPETMIEKKVLCTYCGKKSTYKGSEKALDPETFVCDNCLTGEKSDEDEDE